MNDPARTRLTPGQKAALLLLAELQGDDALRAQISGVEEFCGPATMADLCVDPNAPRSWLPDGRSPINIGVLDRRGELRGEMFLWLSDGIAETVEQTWFGKAPPVSLPERADVESHRYLPVGDGPVRETFFSSDQLPAQQYSRRQPRVTRRHRELIDELSLGQDFPAKVALHACLRTLAGGRLTETWCVGVIEAWTDGPDSFRVVYRLGITPQTLGLRREIGQDPGDPLSGAPASFGTDVAYYDLGEPLGTVADRLRLVDGVHWWGDPDPPRGPPGHV